MKSVVIIHGDISLDFSSAVYNTHWEMMAIRILHVILLIFSVFTMSGELRLIELEVLSHGLRARTACNAKCLEYLLKVLKIIIISLKRR